MKAEAASAASTASLMNVVMELEMKLMVIVAELLFFLPSNEAGGSLEVAAVYRVGHMFSPSTAIFKYCVNISSFRALKRCI